MSDFIESKQIKTRKDHECCFCTYTIPKYSIAMHSKGKFDGEWFNHYMCELCSYYMDNIYCENEFEYGQFKDEIEYNFSLMCDSRECIAEESNLSFKENNIQNKRIIFECDYCDKLTIKTWEEIKIIWSKQK